MSAGQRPRAYRPSPWLLAQVVALLVALAVRLPLLLRGDFPINDGGMFLAMSHDVLQAHFALPAVTSYNAEQIPFAYPPLAFYLTAAVAQLTGMGLESLVRWLPLVANLVTVLAVGVLARALLPRDRLAQLAAPVIFALIPRSYEWLIMGGGLTRSVGFCFAVVCLSLARPLFERLSPLRLAACALLAALALLSHLEEGIFVFYSLGLMAVVFGHGWRVRSLLTYLLVAGLAVLLTAPWWAVVLGRYGPGPFYAASLTSEWTTLAGQMDRLGAFLAPPSVVLAAFGTLGVLGGLLCLARGQWLLPLWLPLVFLLTPRSAETEGTLPLALLAAHGIGLLLPPLLHRARRGPDTGLAGVWSAVDHAWRGSARVRVGTAVVGLGALLGGLVIYWPATPTTPNTLDILPPGDRQAMQWVSQHAAADARFVVLSSTWSWEEDMAGEWFPVLANRPSLLTPQGTEWLPSDAFDRRVCLFDKVRDIAADQKSVADLDAWAANRGVSFSDIYVSKAERGTVDWSTLIASALASPNYQVSLNTPEAAVLHRITPVQSRWPASGADLVSLDCQSFGDQSAATQQTFEAAYGGDAARAWVQQHDRLVPQSGGLLASVVGRVSRIKPAL